MCLWQGSANRYSLYRYREKLLEIFMIASSSSSGQETLFILSSKLISMYLCSYIFLYIYLILYLPVKLYVCMYVFMRPSTYLYILYHIYLSIGLVTYTIFAILCIYLFSGYGLKFLIFKV